MARAAEHPRSLARVPSARPVERDVRLFRGSAFALGGGIGIGIGIDVCLAIAGRFLCDGVATPTELGQHGDDTVEHPLSSGIFLGRESTADFQDILDRAALQSRPAGDLKMPAAITVCR